jgi:exodeoxyribonuclease V beta subunit
MTLSLPFDISRRPVPGLTVLEASAGTGKTYSIAGLAVLGFAQGDFSPREVCVVTFTEAATAELAGRLRSRIVQGMEALQAPREKWSDIDDTVDKLLIDSDHGDDENRQSRLERLQQALSEFDAMTVSTIHGFCQRLLTSVGAATSDISSDSDDVSEVVHDVILAGKHTIAHPSRVITAVHDRLALPDARMAEFPEASVEVQGEVNELIQVVETAVAEVNRRRRRWRRGTFDSMLADTRELLLDEHRGPAIIAELRSRFRLVLVDEFQDTDTVQWEIFRTAYLEHRSGLTAVPVVVVGDPKQSIYRFRGAELSAYLSAVDYADEHGGQRFHLDTNYRSDAEMLVALDHMFAQSTFGDDRVTFKSVLPGKDMRGYGLDDDRPPMQVRSIEPPPNEKGVVDAGTARSWVIADVVHEVSRLLNETHITRRPEAGAEPLHPSDIGIVVKSNADAETFAMALRAAGIPAVTSGTDSVLESPAARHWHLLIRSLQRPNDIRLARMAAIGVFGGIDVHQLDDFDGEDEASLLELQQHRVRALSTGGVSRLLAVLRQSGFQQRVLNELGGERLLTDIEHIAELLHRSTRGIPCSSAQLETAFQELKKTSTDRAAGDVLNRRLDRDDDTVSIMTIHKAKGLEFPVVLCPTLWTSSSNSKGLPHAELPEEGGRKFNTYWVTGGKSQAKAVMRVKRCADAETEGEERRNLYVALTRAVHKLVLWTVPGYINGKRPLNDLLEQSCGGDLRSLSTRIPKALELVRVDSRPARVQPAQQPVDESSLLVSMNDRAFDETWKVWSFTSIERALQADADRSLSRHDATPVIGGLDEPGATDEEASLSVPSDAMSLQSIPGSAAFGTLVHSLLEHLDFTSPSAENDLSNLCLELMQYQPIDCDPVVLAQGLSEMLTAPLGGPLGEANLASISRNDRLDELDFLLPLTSTSAELVAEVVVTGLPADDPFRSWFQQVADGRVSVPMTGMLTGSIDLVARVNGSYFIADYKTNRIGNDARFTTGEMTNEMNHHGYPLQALLYLVAVRRFLRHRQPTTHPDDVLLGAAYLFVRGMDPSRPSDDARGVMWWQPPGDLLDAVDKLFGEGESS